jgi:hypothetical protein
MTARVDIVNLALTWMGANQITSLDDDAPEARVMKVNYEICKDATLEEASWSFAIKRWIPAQDATPPVAGAAIRYKIPSDIIRVLRVGRPSDELYGGGWANLTDNRTIDRAQSVDFRVESGYIITNESSITCKGIRRVSDEGSFSNLFSHAFAAHLAMITAYSITESDGTFNAMSALYQLKIQEAKSRDGLQGTSRRIRNRSLQYAR